MSELYEQLIKQRRARVAFMPAEPDALGIMFEAWQRLIELGWREIIYCPKDGTPFLAIEAGSTGIHKCVYTGDWPDGRWWIIDENQHDLYPSRPILFKLIESEVQTI